MDTAEAPKAPQQRPSQPRQRAPSQYLCKQQELQGRMGCDYALVWYERDPKTPPGQCPNFLTVGDPIPVSLSHHVFMRMAFGVLKDRLLRPPVQKKATTVGKKEEKDQTRVDASCKETETPAECTNDAEGPKKKKGGPTRREQDVVALFCFLWQYVASMLRSQEEALQAVKKRGKKGPPPQPTVRMTRQQLRLQMVLEYNVDVHRVLGDGLKTENAVSEDYCRMLLTGNVMEEEFLNQLAKPAGMAQTCSVM